MEQEIQVQQELIPVERINVPQLFTDKQKADVLLSAIAVKAKEHKADISTATGRKEIASNAFKVSQSKTFLDGIGKDFLSARKAEIKITDAIRKQIRDTLDALRDEVRAPLTQYEEAEKERIRKEQEEAQLLSDWDEAISMNDLFDREREVARKEAELKRQEEERLAKEAAERAEQERIEREKRIAQEAADRAKREAEESVRQERERIENEKKEAERKAAQAEADRIAAIERAKADAEKAALEAEQAVQRAKERAEREARAKEAARLLQEAQDRAEAERKARNKAHQKAVNNEALKCFEQNGIDKETAIAIIKLIADRKIKHITVNY